MRLLSWLLFAAAAIIPATNSEESKYEESLQRAKRESGEKKIVCYYTNWSVYRPGTAKFSPQNINPYLCTHLIYAFGGLSKENALKPFDKYQDIEQGGYAKFNGLKTYNKNLKTMLAIGGWNEGSARFSPLVADAERRRELVKNTVRFLRQNHFDGLDLDWEYPSFRDGGKPRDRDNYATLVQEFRREFERESEKTGRTRLLLTMAVPAGIEYIDKGYDVPKLNEYLDWMNILSYDYHSAFEPAINHHSPLFSLEEDDEYNFDAQLSIDHTVKHYIKLGADRSKLVLGIPTYGRSYTLFNPDATEIGSPADGPGEQGEATREKGYLAYYEICERISSGGWSRESPYPDAMGPYAFKENQWVGYDDEEIARAKAKYVNEMDLGGIMFWSIDNDDFRGKCHGKAYPIIEAAKEALLASSNELVPRLGKSESGRSNSKKQGQTGKTRGSRIRTKTTTEESKSSGRTTTPQPPTTPDPGSDFVCKDEGFFPHPRDCKKYFWCLDSGPSSLGIVAHQFTCPSGLVFNKISDSCDYARNVVCKNKAETSATTTTTTTTSTTTARAKTTAKTRLVVTASPPKTTTTEEPEFEEDDEEGGGEEEEDPGTIKELIDLIKKLGGIEQLEKQLNLQNSDAKEKIKPSLYTKVLKARPANRFRGVINDEELSTPRYSSVFRNRPNAPQASSTEGTSRKYERPKYVTIQRNRPTKKPIESENESEEEEEGEEEETAEEVQSKRKAPRRRPQVESGTTEKEYVVLRRTRPQKVKDEKDSTGTSKYKSAARFRSTTEASPEEVDEAALSSSSSASEEGYDDEDVERGRIRDSEERLQGSRQDDEKGEVVRNYKNYSSVKRDKKIVDADEEEIKVSGPNGTESEGERPSSTSGETTTNGRHGVNNVQKLTSPKYVEIRRTQSPATESLAKDVNIVNNSPETDRENERLNVEEGERIVKVEGNDFEVERTTETIRRVYRPLFRPTATEQSTDKEGGFQRSTDRFGSPTESSSSPASKPSFGRYKTINRNTTAKPASGDDGDRTRGATTTTATETTSTHGTGQRRYQFAPRGKPAILSPEPAQKYTTESFRITVADLPSQRPVENASNDTPSLPLLSSPATVTPANDFPTADKTNFNNERENENDASGENAFFPTTRHFDPTTSTETSVVTSVTESLFTERKRIMVHRKDFNLENDFSFATVTSAELPAEVTWPSFSTPEYQPEPKSFGTPAEPKSFGTPAEPPKEVTRPSFKASQQKNPLKSAAPKTDKATDFRRRRYKTKSIAAPTTTAEEPPKPQQRYVPKKTRVFKKIATAEPVEPTTASTQRVRFVPRNRPRLVDKYSIEPLNSLNLQRFSNTRKRKVVSKKDEEDDGGGGDLKVEQSSSYYEDEFESDGRYDSRSGFGETLEKNDESNDVSSFRQPTAQAERVESGETSKEDFSNSVDVPETTDSSSSPSNDGKVNINANEFVTPAFDDLRTRVSLSRQSGATAAEKQFQPSTESTATAYKNYNTDFNFFSFGTPSIGIPEASQSSSETNGYSTEENTSQRGNGNSNRNDQIATEPSLATPEMSGETATEIYSSTDFPFRSTREPIETSIYTIDPSLYNFETFGAKSQGPDTVSRKTWETTTPVSATDSVNRETLSNFRIIDTGTSDDGFDRDSGKTGKHDEDDTDPNRPPPTPDRKRIRNYVYTANANFKTSKSRTRPLDSADGENPIETVKISTVDSDEEARTDGGNVIGNGGGQRQKFRIFKIKSRKLDGSKKGNGVSETIGEKTTAGTETGERSNKIYSPNSNLRKLRNRYEKANEVTGNEKNSQNGSPDEEKTEGKETTEGKTSIQRSRLGERNSKIFPTNFRKLKNRYEKANEVSTKETTSTAESDSAKETDLKYSSNSENAGKFRKYVRNGQAGRKAEIAEDNSTVSSDPNERLQRPRFKFSRPGSRPTEETIFPAVSTSPSRSTKEPSTTLASNPSQSTARTTESVNETKKGPEPQVSRANESADVSGVTGSSETGHATPDPRIGEGSTSSQTNSDTSISQIGSKVDAASFDPPDVGMSTPPAGESSTALETTWFAVSFSSHHLSDPNTASTFGSKTDAAPDVTQALSSPLTSTETSTTGHRGHHEFNASSSTLGLMEFPFVSSTNEFARPRTATPSSTSSKRTEESSETVRVSTSLPQASSVIPRRRIIINRKYKASSPETNESSRESAVTESDPTSSEQGFRRIANETVTVDPRGKSKFRVIKARVRTNENSTAETVSETGNGKFSKKGKRVLVRSRPVNRQSRPESKEKEGEPEETEATEAPSSTTLRINTSRRFNQELYTGARNKFRPTTTTTTEPTLPSERPERRRPQSDGRRFRKERRPTTVKYEAQTEEPSTTLRPSTHLRRRPRPTATTTERPYAEVEDDSSLEESKTIDESPDFQDLADPAVVAIHTLATVPPGSISTGRPLTYFGPPDTYTVHVTESDIESITPGRISTTEPGTSRPTSILTLKPFTIPVITRQPAKQTSFPIRTSSAFRALGREESPVERGEPEKSRRFEIVSKSRPVISATQSPSPKQDLAKPRQPKPFSKVNKEVVQTVGPSDPPEYEYYDDDDENPLANIPASALKVKVHSNGYIECLDRGNFPHPFSCKKFISCAKMENNELLGWEYTCPKHLSFDPVGGICNWSAGLGCQH